MNTASLLTDRETLAFLAGMLFVVVAVFIVCIAKFHIISKDGTTGEATFARSKGTMTVAILLSFMGLLLMYPFLSGLLKNTRKTIGVTKTVSVPLYAGPNLFDLPKPDTEGQPYLVSFWIQGPYYDCRGIIEVADWPYGHEVGDTTAPPVYVRFYHDGVSKGVEPPKFKINPSGKLEVDGNFGADFSMRYGVMLPQF